MASGMLWMLSASALKTSASVRQRKTQSIHLPLQIFKTRGDARMASKTSSLFSVASKKLAMLTTATTPASTQFSHTRASVLSPFV